MPIIITLTLMLISIQGCWTLPCWLPSVYLELWNSTHASKNQHSMVIFKNCLKIKVFRVKKEFKEGIETRFIKCEVTRVAWNRQPALDSRKEKVLKLFINELKVVDVIESVNLSTGWGKIFKNSQKISNATIFFDLISDGNFHTQTIFDFLTRTNWDFPVALFSQVSIFPHPFCFCSSVSIPTALFERMEWWRKI